MLRDSKVDPTKCNTLDTLRRINQMSKLLNRLNKIKKPIPQLLIFINKWITNSPTYLPWLDLNNHLLLMHKIPNHSKQVIPQ